MVEITLSGPDFQLTGYRYWWLKYVKGFDPKNHCAKCLIGPYSKKISAHMPMQTVTLNEVKDFKFIYLCGVSYAGYAQNFHLALMPDEGSGQVKTFNGFTVAFKNARALLIPALPDGYNGLSKAYTTCRNFQFGVHYFERGLKAFKAESVSSTIS